MVGNNYLGNQWLTVHVFCCCDRSCGVGIMSIFSCTYSIALGRANSRINRQSWWESQLQLTALTFFSHLWNRDNNGTCLLGLFWELKKNSSSMWHAQVGAWHMAVNWLKSTEWMNASALWGTCYARVDLWGNVHFPWQLGRGSWMTEWLNDSLITFWNHRHSPGTLGGGQISLLRGGWWLSEAVCKAIKNI